jgi:hypothetical protein
MLITCATDGSSSLLESPEGHVRIPKKRKAGVKSAASFTPQQVEARWQAYQAKLARPDMQQLSATRASLPIANYRCALPLPAANFSLLIHLLIHSLMHSFIHSCTHSFTRSLIWCLLARSFFFLFICPFVHFLLIHHLFLQLFIHCLGVLP